MKKIIKSRTIPENSLILSGFENIDYCDIYQIRKKTDKSAEVISKDILQMPKWVLVLMKLRNRIVSVFGLKTDKNTEEADTFFTVIKKSENEIVMGEVDKHLDFRLSILKSDIEGTISLITAVHFNNIWGRLYFFIIKPFHKVILKTTLKRYLNSLSARQAKYENQ